MRDQNLLPAVDLDLCRVVLIKESVPLGWVLQAIEPLAIDLHQNLNHPTKPIIVPKNQFIHQFHSMATVTTTGKRVYDRSCFAFNIKTSDLCEARPRSEIAGFLYYFCVFLLVAFLHPGFLRL